MNLLMIKEVILLLYLYFIFVFLIVIISVGFLTENKNQDHKLFNFLYSCCIGWLLITFSMGAVGSLIRDEGFALPPLLTYFIMFVLPLITFFLFEVNLYNKQNQLIK